MEPLHEALKKRLAQHEQMHGHAEGQQVNDHPIPGHGDGPEAGAEAQAEANRNAIALQGLDSQGGPDETGGRDDRHQMGNVEQQSESGDASEDEEAFDRMYPSHGNEVPNEHGRTLASKMQHHVAKNILHRGVEGAARPRAHIGKAAMKQNY